VSATPRAPRNQWIRCQACGAIDDPIRCTDAEAPPLDVNDDDLALGGDQYRH